VDPNADTKARSQGHVAHSVVTIFVFLYIFFIFNDTNYMLTTLHVVQIMIPGQTDKRPWWVGYSHLFSTHSEYSQPTKCVFQSARVLFLYILNI
jgi:hypothetical protein